EPDSDRFKAVIRPHQNFDARSLAKTGLVTDIGPDRPVALALDRGEGRRRALAAQFAQQRLRRDIRRKQRFGRFGDLADQGIDGVSEADIRADRKAMDARFGRRLGGRRLSADQEQGANDTPGNHERQLSSAPRSPHASSLAESSHSFAHSWNPEVPVDAISDEP